MSAIIPPCSQFDYLVSFECISIDVFHSVLLTFFLPSFIFFVAPLALVLIDVTTLMQSSRTITNYCSSLFVDSIFLEDTLSANTRFLENIDYLQLQMKNAYLHQKDHCNC